MTRAPRELANWRENAEPPPSSQEQDDPARLEPPDLGYGVPGGDASTRQCGALLEAQMVGNGHEAGLPEHDLFSQHAVERAAEGAVHRSLAAGSVGPILEETCGDPVTHTEGSDPAPNLHDFSGGVRVGHSGQCDSPRHRVPDDLEIAIVQGSCPDADAYLPGTRWESFAFHEFHAVDAGVRSDVPGAHVYKGTKSYSPIPWRVRNVAERSPALMTRWGRPTSTTKLSPGSRRISCLGSRKKIRIESNRRGHRRCHGRECGSARAPAAWERSAVR
jgi:hypothetical protein